MPKRKISRKKAWEAKLKEEQRRINCGKRYDEETIQEACRMKREGFTTRDIQDHFNTMIQRTTLIRWFKANGIYDEE